MFNFNWFKSSKRKEELEKIELAIKKKQLEYMEKTPVTDADGRPYRQLMLTGDTVLVTLADGTVLSRDSSNPEKLFRDVKNASSQEEILSMFTERVVEVSISGTPEERDLIDNYADALLLNGDFDRVGKEYFLKGVKLALPPVVMAAFIEVVEQMMLIEEDESYELWSVDNQWDELNVKYNALKMFWYWTALNPIAESRKDLLTFVRNNKIRITADGLLAMYRRVVSVQRTDKGYTEFVSTNYLKIKSWKKSPANYSVVEKDGDYKLVKAGDYYEGELLGFLDDLYDGLKDKKENIFTDNHTKTKEIKVGQIYKEDEDKIDLDNRQACSSGLHVGGLGFGFSGFGDTGVLALVNPRFVRSVPVSEHHKMRVSEMYIAAIMELDDYQAFVEDETAVANFSSEYFSMSVEELERAVREKDFETFTCQDQAPDVSMTNIQDIKDILSRKVVNY